MSQGKYTEDIKKVPEGYNEVLKVQLRQEAKMKKQPEILNQFNDAFKKKIEQGIYRPLSEVLRENPELEDAQKIFAPVVYSMKESSVNHRLRICVNQSFTVGDGQLSFNDACLKGSSLNFNIWDI